METTLSTDKKWELEEWRKPKLSDGDLEIFSEPGRILYKTDYRSHWFVLVKREFGFYRILVQHGAGEESFPFAHSKRYVDVLSGVDSDSRYLLMHAFADAYNAGNKQGREETASKFRKAFVEGRLKKRKQPNQATVKVWIEPSAT